MTADPIRKLLPYTSIAVVIAALYVAYTFYSRETASEQADQRIEEKSVEQDRDSVSRMGGTALKITSFYAVPPVVQKGQSTRLCYGVINAQSLELSPPVEKVWPSLSRCFNVAPRETATYILTAHGKQGTTTNTLTVTVQ